MLCSHDGHIKAVFLPPNTTAVIQPLDGGVLEIAKRNYRKLLLRRVLAENEGENSPSLLATIKQVNMKDVAYMTGEAWEDVKAETISKVWRKTLLNRVDQLDGTEASSSSSSESDPSSETDGEAELDTAMMSEELREAGFIVNEADVQEWLTVDRHEPGYTVLTEEEIVEAVSRPEHESEEEGEEDVADEPAIPSHSEAFACFSTCVQWLEAQTDCDPVSAQLLRRLQQKAANKHASTFKQQRITNFFS